MDHPFLIAIPFAFLSCNPFGDPSLELDPALSDSTLAVLADSEHFQVVRRHILESFGSFGCVSCPDAEAKLLPYFHPELNSPGYNPNLVVVTYHVKFGTLNDPWVTSATQARYDQSFANSLPQATMDGSNAQFGIRETDVRYKLGEYDSLVYRLRILPPLTYLDLRLDTIGSAYDSITGVMIVRFAVLNRDTVSQGPLSFRVLAVKNLSVKSPFYPIPWEVIVAETTDRDSSGRSLIAGGLPPLTAKSFTAALTLPPESGKNPPPPNPENPADYALIVVAKNGQGIVQNVVFLKYGPK